MNRTPGLGLLLGALLPASALAQDFVGNFALEGRLSGGKTTQVQLRIRAAGKGFKVERSAKNLDAAGAVVGTSEWSCSQARRVSATVLRATYRIEPEGGLNKVLSGLDPAAPDADLGAALRQTNVFEALYVIGADGKALREVVVNTTRLDGERWKQINTRGQREDAAPGAALSPDELEKRVHAALERWYTDWTKETYEELLAEAKPADKPALQAQRDADLDFSQNDISQGDDYLAESIDERYTDGDEYRRQDGSKVERKDVRIYALSMYPQHAGIGLSKSFVFDARTGELLEEGELQD